MTLATLVLAGAAAAMLIGFLVKRPTLTGAVKVWLLFAVGALPLGAAFTGNVAGFQASATRRFCASCHEMDAHARDAADPTSATLAAMHSRNRQFGDKSCYQCHQDYGMFGTVTTKLGGMRHMWAHYTRDANAPLALYKPFPTSNCTQCHSMTLPGFKDEPEHQAVMEDLVSGNTGCAAKGCHGPAHGEKKEGK